MCGIAGIFHYRERERPVDTDLLLRMTRVLAHRGPDGEGIWVGPGIGLGHRRLAILDPSERARQPMTDGEGSLVISYNGEIYNFRELRGQLEGLGHAFASTGDTEVILAAYREWGDEVLDRLSGIFAFALWDGDRRRLLLARDPIGVKPLFYSLDGRAFRFASEIKAILMDPAVERDLDLEALDAFFTLSYTPAPATGFRSIRQLLPGHAAAVTQGGFSCWRYWSYPRESPGDVDFGSALRAFGRKLEEVTHSQLVSDVAIGAFLSGGLDSAALVNAMRRTQGDTICALNVGFDLPGFDERAGARASARAIGVELREVLVSIDATDLIPSIARHLEEPTADSSALPLYLLCREAASEFKVAISGDGADELLAGYETYRASRLARTYRRIPKSLRGLLPALARTLPITDAKYSLRDKATRFLYGAELGPGLDHCAWRIAFTEPLKDRLYSEHFRSLAKGYDPLGAYASHIWDGSGERADLEGLLKADTEFYLPNDMLVKIDRMSMAHGLEVRVPYLDVEMVRFCATLPSDFKLHRGRVRKHILRESLRPLLPESVLHAPKSGFNIPLASWMRGSLGDQLLDAVDSVRVDLSRFLEPAEVERLLGKHRQRRVDRGHELFTILMFTHWLDNAATAWRPGNHRPASTRLGERSVER